MRRGLLLGGLLGAMNAAIVLLLAWLLDRPSDFGWYAYSPMPRRYVDYLPASHVVTGWAAVGLVAGILIAANMLVMAAYILLRRRPSAGEPTS